LTNRQHEVVALVAQGASNKGIAETLSISEKTVEKHLKSARAKLGAFSRTQLVALICGGGTLPAFLRPKYQNRKDDLV
jgi:DNA-binding CsgD family transcriptional regulator